MNNIKLIRPNNVVEIKNMDIKTVISNLQKFKILISQNEYFIKFSLHTKMFIKRISKNNSI
ncbi:hypothetical protein BAN_0061700 [Borrelia anserina BA2]|uniref:Uncharacterized protein n=2 Tax=Borrelia anserina TaxID=143 RepID=W5SNM8_BORAN|nr:hypothetical protein BAN_0061700 [Borrelia anserina BA2]APR64982.1 hypothetical protein N187_02615 [Borrelia anserina Es]